MSKNISNPRAESKSPARLRPKKWSQAQTDRFCEYFYTAGEKTDYILLIFNYYRKLHSTTVLTFRGTTFWARSRRRFTLSSRVLNIFTRGLLLRTRHEVYSSNQAEFRCQNHPWTNWDNLFYYVLRWGTLLSGMSSCWQWHRSNS